MRAAPLKKRKKERKWQKNLVVTEKVRTFAAAN